MDPNPGLESALRRHEELTARLDGPLERRVAGAPAAVWGGQDDRAYVLRAIAGMTHGHWPPPAEEYTRVVMDICRAVVARVSRTGSPDWSTVSFGPGHGVAGVSVEVPEPGDGALFPELVTISVWELDIVDEGDTGAEDAAATADPDWAARVRERLQTIVGPVARGRAGVHRHRARTGSAVFQYARQELLTDYPAPRSAEELSDLALTCGRLAESSVLAYEVVEQRTALAQGASS